MFLAGLIGAASLAAARMLVRRVRKGRWGRCKGRWAARKALYIETPTPQIPPPPAFKCDRPLPEGLSIRSAVPEDQSALFQLMRHVARQRGGLAREEDEVTESYVAGMMDALQGGVMLLVEAETGAHEAAVAAASSGAGVWSSPANSADSPSPSVPSSSRILIGVLKSSRLGPHRCFRHVLSDCTLAIHPAWQRKGLGQQLFSALFERLTQHFPHVLRVELIARQSNAHALAMYEKVGFRLNARLASRIVSGMPLYESGKEYTVDERQRMHSEAVEHSVRHSAECPLSPRSVTPYAAAPWPHAASSCGAAASPAPQVSSSSFLRFESDVMMVWFNPAFDMRALEAQFAPPAQ
jgi:ribosomal protein S18 acetylase RimI-like enzyme